ncbi:membrane-associated protein [Haloechinothrix alba]|uniref:Membrane-associated protein n=1 Tax=Haloechinothrix alba TaxID=664784 RepID=A0A238Y8A8_9PSEU|nr:membrane-associated protein [Haloechinothrix alba]
MVVTEYAGAADVGLDLLTGAGPVMLWLVVLSFIFAQCGLIIGLVLPGGTLLFPVGIMLAQQNADLQVWLMAIAATIAAIAGNLTGYVIGHKAGTVVAARKGGTLLSREKVDRARTFLNRHGVLAVVAARWIPWAGTLTPLIAGAAGMDRRRYAWGSTLGAILWVPVVLFAGFYAAGLLTLVPQWLETAVVWGLIGLVLASTVYGVWRYVAEMRKPIDPMPGPEQVSRQHS